MLDPSSLHCSRKLDWNQVQFVNVPSSLVREHAYVDFTRRIPLKPSAVSPECCRILMSETVLIHSLHSPETLDKTLVHN